MTETGTCASFKTVAYQVDRLESDYDRPVSNEALLDAARRGARSLPTLNEQVDPDIRGDDAFGV